MTTRVLAALCATVLTAVGATVVGAPTQAEVVRPYVALGDSFSSGTGTRAKVDACYRSPYGYPPLLAADLGLPLDYQACTGATTADVRADQLETLDRDTGYVTMTIGGNDIGFAEVLTVCALPGWLSNCGGRIEQARQVMRTQLPGRLDSLYGEIRTRAPEATVAVAGYPYLFNGEDCNLATFFSPGEQAELNAGTAELDTLISNRVAAVGFTYVEVRDDFDGHAWCDDPEWVNGLSLPVEESYHPNRLGNVAYAAAFRPALGGSQAQVGATGFAPSDAAAGRATVRPSLRQQADAVLGLRLDSPANLRRAADKGVDTARITASVARLRSANPAVARAGLEELQKLDAAFEAANR